jgi:leader peptidase (prepilin peptidase)/N-methyltransferase
LDAAQAWLALGWGALGWLVGLGLNHIIHQLPNDKPIRQRARCPQCGAPIPLLGGPIRSRCPGCGASTGYDRVEWVVAVLFLLLAASRGPSPDVAIYSLYASILVIIAAIDARHRYVYSIVSYPGLLLAVALSPILSDVGLASALVGLAVGGGVFLFFYVAGRLLYRGGEPLATGDITIAALVGTMVGFPRVVNALFLGMLASAVLGLLVILIQRRGRRTFVPYGPGLCAGAMAAFFITP